MKRALFLVLLLSMPAFADEIQPPKWSEFCPPGYCDAQVGPIPKPAGAGMAVASVVAWPVLFPVMAHKNKAYAEALSRNYWAQRRVAFENEVQLCDHTSGDKALCYMQIRQMEGQKNDARRQERQLEAIRQSFR